MSDNILLEKVLNLVAIKEMEVHAAVRNGAIASVTTIVGGVLGGTIGLVIGGIAGSFLAGVVANETFVSVSQIIRNKLSGEEIRALLSKIRNFIVSQGLSIIEFVSSKVIKPMILNEIVAIVKSFLASKGLRVQCRQGMRFL